MRFSWQKYGYRFFIQHFAHCILGAVHKKTHLHLDTPTFEHRVYLAFKTSSRHSLLSFYFKIYATQFTITNDIIVTAVLYHTSH